MCGRVSQLQDDDAQQDHHSARANAFVSARVRETVALCREICGGNGVQLGGQEQLGIPAGYGIARYFADAEAVYSYEGTHEVNSLIVGRALTGSSAFV
jgi:glutaryl-CoA dehydrogenase